jgi:hypothetical protein
MAAAWLVPMIHAGLLHGGWIGSRAVPRQGQTVETLPPMSDPEPRHR